MTNPPNVTPRTLDVPRGVPVARYKPPAKVEIGPGAEIPLIPKDGPDERKLQEVWVAHARVFRLNNAEDLRAYEEVWQKVTDGLAVMSESRVDFTDGQYVALLRWADFVYKLPNV
jgi:hypothetical protein